MIQLTYGHLRNPNFFAALNKISSTSFGTSQKEFQRSLRIGKTIEEISKNVQEGQDHLRELVQKYALKDENGKIKAAKDQEGTYVIPDENEQAWDEELSKVWCVLSPNENDKIKTRKWLLVDLEKVTDLVPADLVALEPMLNLEPHLKAVAKSN